MKVAFIAVLFLIGVASAAEVDLDGNSFQNAIDSNDNVLVMFYAPWCGHCKSLKPKWTEASDLVEDAVLAKVDCTEESSKDLCSRFEVRGYPTIKFFKKGKVMDYNGSRETEGIVSWVSKKTGPAVAEIDGLAGVGPFSAKTPSVVGFFSAVGTDAQKAFVEAAEDPDAEDFKFGQVIGELGDHADGEVVFFRGDVGEDLKTTGDAEGLAKWIFENSFPLVQEVGGHNFAKYVSLGKPLMLIFVEPESEEKDSIIKAAEAVAAKHTDTAFSWIDAVKYKAQIKGMGASGDVVPCIIRLSSFGSDNKPIVFEEAITEESLNEWVEGIASGKYKYTPKSEEIPVPNDGPVTVVVGKNFDEIVNDESKDVLLEFYAPWCGHCKKLAPDYERLGAAFAGVDNVVIAKIDGTANDVEAHAEVRGFPTILFYKSNDKTNPVTFSGDRSADGFARWIKEHATVEFDHDSVSL